MTTIACNRNEMAGDSLVSLDGVSGDEFLSKKLYRIGKSIFGESGDNCNDVGIALEWLRAGAKPKDRPRIVGGPSEFLLLELSHDGLFIWNTSLTRDPIHEPIAAIEQIGGSHYKAMAIQPAEFVHANRIPYLEGSVIYYVARWRDKNGIEDLKKARHTIDLLIEMEEKNA